MARASFPKSLDVSKQLDKMAGAKREVIGKRTDRAATPKLDIRGGKLIGENRPQIDLSAITVPATDAAKQWEGWGTALKPAYEPIVLARKPLSEPTVAQNVLRWGTGALNIDKCRIGNKQIQTHNTAFLQYHGQNTRPWQQEHQPFVTQHQGRFPANFLLSHAECCEYVGMKKIKGISGGGMNRDGQGENNVYGKHQGHPQIKNVGYADIDDMETIEEWRCVKDCPVRMLDEQSGERKTGNIKPHGNIGSAFQSSKEITVTFYGDSGGASRFFYCSKASRSERGDDCVHPTVKPLALMSYLCKLICPPNGLILDPFIGSGSTLIAALNENFNAIGIEKEPAYITIAQKRIVSDAPLFFSNRT